MNNDQTIFQAPSAPVKPEEQVPNSQTPVQSTGPNEQASYVGQAYTPSISPYSSPTALPLVSPSASSSVYSQNSQAQPVEYSGQDGNSFKKILKIALGALIVIVILFSVFWIASSILNNKSEKITLTYWGLFEENQVMKGIITDFEKANPNIIIEYSKQDINQYRNRLQARINNGTGPDIFRFHNTWYPMLSNDLLPLPSDTITKDLFSSMYYPVAKKDLIKNGAIYGIPLEIDTLSLYVNKELLSAAGISAPTNWNDFINAARAMTVKGADGKIQKAGAAMGTYDNNDHAADIISLLFLQNRVDFNNLSGSLEQATGALDFYTSFALDENNVWDSTLDPSRLSFEKGNLAMYFGYYKDYFYFKQTNPGLSFQVVPVPQLPKQNITLASYWVEGASVKTKHQKEVLVFLKYLTKKEVAEKLYKDQAKTRDFGQPYARVDLKDSLKENKNVYPFVYQAPFASSSYFADKTFDNGLNQDLNTNLGSAVNSILSGGSSESAYNTLLKEIDSVMQKYSQQ